MRLFGDILKFLVQVFPLLVDLISAEKERRQEREKSVSSEVKADADTKDTTSVSVVH